MSLPLRIALPPSEGKAAGGNGPPLDLASLSDATTLTRPRELVLAALVRRCSSTTPRGIADARKVLGLPPGLAGEIAVNGALLTAPTLPASARYTGVLYDRLGLAALPDDAARRRAQEHVLIVSGLWGVVRPDDRIPAYRLSMDVALGRLGRLAAFWREPVARALPDPALVVDCRSATYQQAWRPVERSAVVQVRVFEVAADGARKVVSHMAKATRGDVARALLMAGLQAGVPGDVADVVRGTGLRCELAGPVKDDGAWTLDVLR